MIVASLVASLVLQLSPGRCWLVPRCELRPEEPRITNIRENARRLPGVDRSLIEPILMAAKANETYGIPAELLVAIAWFESRFNPDPNAITGRRSKFCGSMQVYPPYVDRRWDARKMCQTWRRDVMAAMYGARRGIEVIKADPRINGRLGRALMYRSCGESFLRGTCRKHPGIADHLIREAKRLSRPPVKVHRRR
jgi:hypothetical protein